jgi:hypothetical protein
MHREISGARSNAHPLQLRGRVYRSLVGVFLVFLAAGSVALWWQHDQALLAEQGRAENLAHVLAEHLERTFGPIESALNQLAVYSDRIGGPQAPREARSPVMAATLSGLSGIGSLNVIDADGLVTLSTNPAITGTSRSDRFLYRQLKDDPSNRLVVAPPIPSATYSGVIIPVGRALRDHDGRFSGLLAATFQPDRLRSFYAAIDVGPQGVIQLIHPDGFLLFRQPLAGHAAGELIADQAIVKGWQAGSGRGVLRAPIENGGEPYLDRQARRARPLAYRGRDRGRGGGRNGNDARHRRILDHDVEPRPRAHPGRTRSGRCRYAHKPGAVSGHHGPHAGFRLRQGHRGTLHLHQSRCRAMDRRKKQA